MDERNKMELKEKLEGLDSKNVLSWRVPHTLSPSASSNNNNKKELPSPSSNSHSAASEFLMEEIDRNGTEIHGLPPAKSIKRLSKHHLQVLANRGPKTPATPTESVLSASDQNSESSRSRSNFQNRLWKFLFSNINRAVDELYYLIEEEDSISKCREGINLFIKCQNDFEKLISRIEDQRIFVESGGSTGGVSWEVRKHVSAKDTDVTEGGVRVLELDEVYVNPIVPRLGIDTGEVDLDVEAESDCEELGALHSSPPFSPFELQGKTLTNLDTSLSSDKATKFTGVNSMADIDSLLVVGDKYNPFNDEEEVEWAEDIDVRFVPIPLLQR